MKAAGGPHRIVNIGSLSSFLGAPNITAYTASKHAVLGLSDVLAMELAAERSPVGITRVCPGIINTPLLSGKAAGVNITQRQLLQQQEYYRTHGCTPDVVADGVVKAVQRGNNYCFVGPKAKLGVFGIRLSHNLAHTISVKESTPMEKQDSGNNNIICYKKRSNIDNKCLGHRPRSSSSRRFRSPWVLWPGLSFQDVSWAQRPWVCTPLFCYWSGFFVQAQLAA